MVGGRWFDKKDLYVLQAMRDAGIHISRIVRIKLRVFDRDNFKCTYCGSEKRLTADHIVPKHAGGKYTEANLTTACFRCNQAKGGRKAETFQKSRNKITKHKQTDYLKEIGE